VFGRAEPDDQEFVVVVDQFVGSEESFAERRTPSAAKSRYLGVELGDESANYLVANSVEKRFAVCFTVRFNQRLSATIVRGIK